MESDYHPELDKTDELDGNKANYYQNLIGILQWVVELGRIDIALEVSTMAWFNCNPRTGHLRNTLRILMCLKGHTKSKFVMDCCKRDIDQFTFPEYNWTRYYPGAAEVIPDDMPCPLGELVQITVFANASFAGNMVTHKSVTGILIFVNGPPIMWLSKRQVTLETSTFGSEFVALRVAVEMVEALLCYKLRMFGVLSDGPANAFCDNLEHRVEFYFAFVYTQEEAQFCELRQGPFLHCCWHHSCYKGAR